jgi:hypothetical protein
MKQPCKCGRRWEARFFSQHAYCPICPGCGKTPSRCTCAPLNEIELGPVRTSGCVACGHSSGFHFGSGCVAHNDPQDITAGKCGCANFSR